MVSMVTSQKVMKGGMPSTSPAMAGPRLSLLRRKAITPKTIARLPHMRFTTEIQINGADDAKQHADDAERFARNFIGHGENPFRFPGAWINILFRAVSGEVRVLRKQPRAATIHPHPG